MGEIKHIVRDTQNVGRALGIRNAVNAAARGFTVIMRDIKTHGHPDGVVAGFFDKSGHHRRIHPAAHGDVNCDVFVISHTFPWDKPQGYFLPPKC